MWNTAANVLLNFKLQPRMDIFFFFKGTMNWDTRRLGCVGVPLPGVSVRIINPETLAELADDTEGEVKRNTIPNHF